MGKGMHASEYEAELKRKAAEKFFAEIHFHDGCSGQYFTVDNPTGELKEFITAFLCHKESESGFFGKQRTFYRPGTRFVKDGLHPKAPLCKGGCHANSVTGELSWQAATISHWITARANPFAAQSLSQKLKIFASSLYTREPFSVIPDSTTPPAFAGGE